MAHNTRPLKRAQDGIAPQYYNELTDEYEVLHGTAGANHVVIYGPDGQPAALATEAKLEAVRALLASLADNDFATQTTLAAVLAALGNLATIANQNAAKTVLDAISTAVAARATETTLQAIKEALTDGSLRAQLSGNIAQLPDVITTDTVITAGSNLILKNGTQPWILDASKRGIAAGYGLSSGVKSKLAIMFYSEKYPTTTPLSTIYLYDSGSSSTAGGSGVIQVAHSSRYALRLFNADAVDMTVKVLTRAEVS